MKDMKDMMSCVDEFYNRATKHEIELKRTEKLTSLIGLLIVNALKYKKGTLAIETIKSREEELIRKIMINIDKTHEHSIQAAIKTFGGYDAWERCPEHLL